MCLFGLPLGSWIIILTILASVAMYVIVGLDYNEEMKILRQEAEERKWERMFR